MAQDGCAEVTWKGQPFPYLMHQPDRVSHSYGDHKTTAGALHTPAHHVTHLHSVHISIVRFRVRRAATMRVLVAATYICAKDASLQSSLSPLVHEWQQTNIAKVIFCMCISSRVCLAAAVELNSQGLSGCE